MSIVAELCTFDEATHQYKRGDTVLPSVSQIITSVWTRSDGAPPDAIELARQRGEFVDRQFMSWLGGRDITIPAGTEQSWADALGQACDYWNEYRKGAKVECQVQLFGEMEAGTLDLLIEGHEIVDLKSTYEISKTVPAQLGGYGDLFMQTRIHQNLTCGVLHVHRRLRKAVFKSIPFADAFAQWRVCRDFYRLINGVLK